MLTRRVLLSAAGILAFCLITSADPPKDTAPAPRYSGPVGFWRVEFANGVVEACQIRADGKASVVEPLRNAAGKAEMRDGTAVIVFEDNRVERWMPVGRRMVVEHWFPAERFPTETPVLGIAELAP